jgi:DUF1680 family protein
VTTRYPWHGRISVAITESAEQPWTLGLRLPAWADGATITVNGVDHPTGPVGRNALLHRRWQQGDEVILDLPVRARRTWPDDRVDSVRGCVAIERGPLVYCFEQSDQPAGAVLDETAVTEGELIETDRPDLLGGVTTVSVPARYNGTETTLTAIPYYAWANRTVGPMTVWISSDTGHW